MTLSEIEKFLQEQTGPRILVEAAKLIGIKETPGPGDNPTILGWAKKLGVDKQYTHDSIPWCGLGMAYVCLQSGWEPPHNFLWALNWANFGVKRDGPAMLGDVLAFKRPGGGHVGMYGAEDEANYYVLGFNQSDMCKVAKIDKKRCVAIRHCPWRINQPAQVRRVWATASGATSTNEA